MPQFAATEKYFGRTSAPSSIPAIPSHRRCCFWPYFPLCCLYLALRWPLPVVPARSVHLSVDDRAPATSSTSPDTSRVSSDIPGVASQPSCQLPWAPTGGLLLLIGHRSPLGSPSLPLLLLIPTTLPLGQRGGKVVPYVAAAH